MKPDPMRLHMTLFFLLLAVLAPLLMLGAILFGKAVGLLIAVPIALVMVFRKPKPRRISNVRN